MHSPGFRLRALLDASCTPIPGAFNALVARAVAQHGFGACYISGAATSVAAGVPDVGILTLDHFSKLIREVSDASGLPLLADADTGFGEAEMVRRTVVDYVRAGGAGLHLEDQVFPKRCGHLDGKKLVPLDHALEKVAAAVAAARATDRPDEQGRGFVICARTDAKGVEGFDAAIDRAAAYVNAGADMIFPEGLASEDEFAKFAKAMRALKGPDPRGGPYLLANMTEFGKTPMIPLEKFNAMGYSCVIYPVTLLRIAMKAVDAALAELKKTGTAEGLLPKMQTRQELYDLIAYQPGVEWPYPARRI